jgi:hypothetical protein
LTIGSATALSRGLYGGGLPGSPSDEALMVLDLYVETTCQLHCLLDSLFVVGALHNFGAPQKVTTASDSVDAI